MNAPVQSFLIRQNSHPNDLELGTSRTGPSLKVEQCKIQKGAIGVLLYTLVKLAALTYLTLIWQKCLEEL